MTFIRILQLHYNGNFMKIATLLMTGIYCLLIIPFSSLLLNYKTKRHYNVREIFIQNCNH